MMGLDSINLDDVQVSQDFGYAKAGNYRLRVAEIKADSDAKGRETISVRHEFVDPANIEIVGGQTLGGLFNTLYISGTTNDKACLSILRRFVEAHGITWDAFKSNRDLQQFQGLEADAYVTYETNNGKTGEPLKHPRNSVNKYLITK